jgi:hypothetical protein
MHRSATFALALASVLAASLCGPVRADIYKYVDRNGVVHLSDHKEHSGFELLVRTRKGWDLSRVRLRPPRERFQFAEVVDEAARTYGLNQALIHAVIAAESGYNPDAVSSAGAVGLMQLMPDTARQYGVLNRRDPHQNIHGGSRYLSELLARFRNLRLALAAYNAGEGAVERHGNRIPPYPETQQYVEKVVQLFRDNWQTYTRLGG